MPFTPWILSRDEHVMNIRHSLFLQIHVYILAEEWGVYVLMRGKNVVSMQNELVSQPENRGMCFWLCLLCAVFTQS